MVSLYPPVLNALPELKFKAAPSGMTATFGTLTNPSGKDIVVANLDAGRGAAGGLGCLGGGGAGEMDRAARGPPAGIGVYRNRAGRSGVAGKAGGMYGVNVRGNFMKPLTQKRVGFGVISMRKIWNGKKAMWLGWLMLAGWSAVLPARAAWPRPSARPRSPR